MGVTCVPYKVLYIIQRELPLYTGVGVRYSQRCSAAAALCGRIIPVYFDFVVNNRGGELFVWNVTTCLVLNVLGVGCFMGEVNTADGCLTPFVYVSADGRRTSCWYRLVFAVVL